jgi:glycosyltransferase involved in cell wall biosynthesis
MVRGIKKTIPINEIDFTKAFGRTPLEKFLNVVWRRKKFILENKNKLSKINHFLQPEIFYFIPEMKNKINIVTVHDLVLLEGLKDIHNFYELVRKILLIKRFNHALKKADFFIADTQQTKEELLKKGIDESKIKVVNLGVDKKFKIIRKFGRRKNIIGYVGSYNPRKRVDKLLKDWKINFRSIRKFKLLLAGWGGSQFEKLKGEYDRKLNVVFIGELPEEKLVSFYNSLKAFIFPTEYEGFGLPILEAVACGAPCFIYKDARISEEVRKYAFEIESVREIPEILENISERELRKKSRKVKREFSWEKTVKETIKVYKLLLSNI